MNSLPIGIFDSGVGGLTVLRELRRLLYRTMHDAGFVVLHCEWWHFEFGTRRWAAIRSERPRYGPAVPSTA